MELLADCVQHAWAGLLDAGEASLAELDLLAPAERLRLLVQWNDTAVPRHRGDSVPALFSRTAAAHADAPAVVEDGHALSYARLDERSSALARHLRDAGVVPGDIVCVALERSASALVAILGVLKAGAAYLPLDRNPPPERLAFALADAGARMVLVASVAA